MNFILLTFYLKNNYHFYEIDYFYFLKYFY